MCLTNPPQHSLMERATQAGGTLWCPSCTEAQQPPSPHLKLHSDEDALLAAGTALDSVSHTGRAVAVSAAQDVVGWLEIINVAGPTAVDYQVR